MVSDIASDIEWIVFGWIELMCSLESVVHAGATQRGALSRCAANVEYNLRRSRCARGSADQRTASISTLTQYLFGQ